MRSKLKKSFKIYILFIFNICVANEKKLLIIVKNQIQQLTLVRKSKNYIYYIYIYYIFKKEL